MLKNPSHSHLKHIKNRNRSVSESQGVSHSYAGTSSFSRNDEGRRMSGGAVARKR